MHLPTRPLSPSLLSFFPPSSLLLPSFPLPLNLPSSPSSLLLPSPSLLPSSSQPFLLSFPPPLNLLTPLSPPLIPTETVVFLYIGMQVFTITTSFRVELIIWSLVSAE